MRSSRSLCVAAMILASAWVYAPSVAHAASSPTMLVTGAQGDATKGTEALDRFKKAWDELRAVNYTLHVTPLGTLATTTPGYDSTVKMTRADAGGWRVDLRGSAKGGADPDATSEFEIAYDGATARSARHSEKVIFERDIEEAGDLMAFLTANGARQAILWELIDRQKPFDDAQGAVHQGQREVDGVMCDVVYIPAPAPKGEEGDPAPIAKSFATRLFIATSDGLPRRLERVEIDDKGNEVARIVEVREWKLDEKAIAGIYSMSTPDGYRVRIQKAARRQPKADPNAGTGRAGLLAAGTQAPDWTLKDGDGKSYSLKDFKGKVVLIDFWATWCGPCVMMMPAIERIHEKYADQGVKVVGIHCWANNAAPEPVDFFKKKGHTYQLLLKGDSVAAAYQVTGIPTFYLIGPDGKVRFAGSGGGGGMEATLRKKIEEILSEPGQN